MAPSLQGQGVGSALLGQAERLYTDTVVDLPSTRTDLLAFYHKRGYRCTNKYAIYLGPFLHLFSNVSWSHLIG